MSGRTPGRVLRRWIGTGFVLTAVVTAGVVVGSQAAGPETPAQSSARAEVASTTPPVPGARNFRDKRGPAATHAGEVLDLNLIRLRVGLALATLALVGWAAHSTRKGAKDSGISPRRVALGLLALLAFGANYNFFTWRRVNGFHSHDVFHYYVGAKYFPELGYYGLYSCSQAALAETSPTSFDPAVAMRNLRTGRLRRTSVLMPRGERCDGAFSPARWSEFRSDVQWFRNKIGDRHWNAVLIDQGYNPSPAWTLMGRAAAELFPATDDSIRRLVRIDLALLLFTFAGVGWAFGFEGLCLAVIAWGANPLARYQWVGDSFLRYPWLAGAVGGLCLLRLRRPAIAGAALTMASLLRVFPALFAAGYAASELRRWIANRRLPPNLVRFAIASFATTVAVVIAAGFASGRDDTYRQFKNNITRYAQITGWNSIGLRPLLSYTSELPEPVVVGDRQLITQEAIGRQKTEVFAARRPLYWAVAGIALLLFWRALRHAEPWEASALGFTLIPVLAQPASYYLSSSIAVALLATRRPQLAVALIVALLGWCAAHLAYYRQATSFVLSSAIAVALALWVLGVYQRSAEPRESG